MLNAETKRSIDAARDVLVGQVPDPKGQVEQITMALLYKFMDAIDREAVENGGKPSFFVGDYKPLAWSELMSETLDAAERFSLYRRGVEGMSANTNLPDTFRGIFKGAFLSFNDPRTLRLFLKEVDGIEYAHSEDLGDAFEYLLSVLGSQGDAGQFRTPRHIIDFIVEVVSPKKNERILDPACGTAGFLISAQKHIYRENSANGKNAQGQALTPAEKTKLAENIVGYEISPDMARLSLANMYLHGLKRPQVKEYDTLTSDAFWEEDFDVILANPPFMTPRGGITPHKRFAVGANRAEVLFVDYIAEHLTLNGRAGIIVPVGIIFQSARAYKSLRKSLVENWGLWAVVSLPAGVFQPYSGVKTSILFIDKPLAKQTDEILFVKVENDGFDLGAQRRPIDKNDLPEALGILAEWKRGGKKERDFALWVKKQKIAEDSDYDLTSDRYRESVDYGNAKWPMVELGEVLDYEQPTNYLVESVDYRDEYKTPVLTAGKSFLLGYTSEENGVFPRNDLPVIIFDDFTTATKIVNFPFKVKSSAMKILRSKKGVNIFFVYYIMQRIKFDASRHKRYWISQYSKIKIPFPPLSEQKRIVAEIEAEQKTIEECKKLIANYEQKIAEKINEVWK